VFKSILEKIPAFIRTVFTLILVLIGWVFFFSPSLGSALLWLARMLGIGTTGFMDATAKYYLAGSWLVVAIGAVSAFPVGANIGNKLLKGRNKLPIYLSVVWFAVLLMLCIAGMIGYILNCFVCVYFLDLAPEILWQYSGFYISYTLLIVVSIAGERFLLRYYESFGYRRLSIRNQGKTSTLKRVIIYGGGLACRMYVCQLYCSSQSENLHIVGIIDDNPALNGLNVYGFNVLGTLRRLDAIYRKKEFDAIVITCKNLSAGKLRRLQEFQKKHHIQLSVFSCEQKDLSE
jgi:FlaA1/EpsC-like NDP-sugar epimerase